MAEVFSGVVCGYALALLVTPLLAVGLLRARVSSELLRSLLPEGSSLIAVMIIIHTFAFVTLTAVGLVLGMLLYGVEGSRPAGGLGSPNQLFTALMIAMTLIAILPLSIAVPRWRLPLLAGGVIFVVTFGWIMPYLSLVANTNG